MNQIVIGPERRRSLIFPREHGAWGILLVPLVTGAAVGLRNGGGGLALVPLTLTVLALFWLRTPLESWVGSTPVKARSLEEIALVKNACLALAGAAAVALSWLLWGWANGQLIWIGAAAGVAFLGQAVIRRVWKKARTAAQMVGSAGLTSVAAASYYVVTSRLDRTTWLLWGLNFLFAANQIQYVQLRIHGAQARSAAEKVAFGWDFLLAQTGMVAALAMACAGRLISWYVAAAFVPVLWRGFAWFVAPFRPLAVHRLGKRELAHSIVFGVLLIMAASWGGASLG